MPLQPLKTTALGGRDPSLLSPSDYDADAVSIRSDQDTDSDDDERQLRARNSRELRAHDRLVLMEEEELDQLVTETRRRQERERRGSGLPIPNPLKLLTRRLSDSSMPRSRSPSTQPAESVEDLVLEKRRARRTRREAKRERLLADAQHGEDGELMYEMEEGGMKDGSSTGESSDREDSDEVDRKNLLHHTQAKEKRNRGWFRWLLFYAIAAVAFAILVLVAWKLSIERRSSRHSQRLVSNGTAMFAPTTILISLDGFRADFLNRGLTPRLNAFVKEGVSPLYMLPSFPSVTFPNHYTLATGLYPESHGVVGNTFWDPALQEEFYYTDPARSMDPKWWMGEPFWVTAQRQGLKTAIHMWPGSEANILETSPTYMDKYNGKEKLSRKVDRIFDFLDMPDADRPQIVAAYVPNVDGDGHKYGPNSTEIKSTIEKVDRMLDDIFKGLEARHLTDIVNVIVVSDHGMATTDISRLVQLEDIVDIRKIEHTDGWPLVGLRPKNPDDLEDIYREVIQNTKANPNLDVYLRDVDMPERYHFSHNERIAPLWIVPKTGWALVKMDEMNLKEAQAKGAIYHPRGLHGYDHEHPLMRAIFVARGPAFPHQPNSRVEVFQNIEVYNMLCDSVGIAPAPNNGTLRLPLKPVGLHSDPGTGLDTPADPVEAFPVSTSAAPEPTKSILVNPISTNDAAAGPTKSVGVDTPAPQPTEHLSSDDSESDSDSDSDDDGGGKSAVDKIESSVKDFWEWFTGKVSHWWDKVKGHDDKSNSSE
ncbi:Ectonucleotide pyrophosphatase/phosphodiesterase family member 3 [Madurella mycetomatis]|uniref:Ectonucleotide pyrophosphatase/phosphodiesterase family member 3 n=1 Tax=Madurella mycetomatis TaxID=100816 RepID=A0A175VT99_9PEZI|nr:Ectonucleotide pyrophosphatase/phosphodiesterase family member 3 [Madurella mycetomatis]